MSGDNSDLWPDLGICTSPAGAGRLVILSGQAQFEMHQLPWPVSLVAFTACASCCALCVALSARLGSVTGIWAPGVVVGEERLQQCCAQAGQCPTLAGAWLAGLGLTLILSFVTSLDMQDLVSGGKELRGVESLGEQRGPKYCGSSQDGAHPWFWIHSILPLMVPQLRLSESSIFSLHQIPSKIVLTVCIFTEMQIPIGVTLSSPS